jgi:DNA-binding transcriptional LysR family regulator
VNLNDVDLRKLRAFRSVVERGGVSPAARALAVTSSAVSQALGGLEEALGVRLFHRVGKRLVPTRAAERLQRRVVEVERLLSDAVGEIAEEKQAVRGLVRIGLFVGFPRTVLARFLRGFCARHPQVEIQVLYAAQAEIEERLLRGRLDLAFALRPTHAHRGTIRATRLFAQELVLAAGKRHFAARFDPRRLEATPIVDYYRQDPLIDLWVRHHFGRRPRRLDVRVWASTTDLVLELVLEQVGVGVLPRSLLGGGRARGELRVISSDKPEMQGSVWLHELAGAAVNHTVAVLRAALVAELGEAPPPPL